MTAIGSEVSDMVATAAGSPSPSDPPRFAGAQHDRGVERPPVGGQLVEAAGRVAEVAMAQRLRPRVDDRDVVAERRERQADGALAAADVEDPRGRGEVRAGNERDDRRLGEEILDEHR